MSDLSAATGIISDVGVIGGAGLIGVVAYFLKKLVTKVDTNSDEMASFRAQALQDIGSLKEGVNQSLLLNKKEIVAMFHDVCHERQGTCSGLVEAKLENLKSHYLKVCQRIDELTYARKDAWKEQRKTNSHLYETLYIRLVNKEEQNGQKTAMGISFNLYTVFGFLYASDV